MQSQYQGSTSALVQTGNNYPYLNAPESPMQSSSGLRNTIDAGEVNGVTINRVHVNPYG